MTRIVAVAIGRNEGERLRRCLASLAAEGIPAVYVDSGSTDGSVALARSMGCRVVELDTAIPFTAARARNAGFAALTARGLPDYVQFLDGDCALESGWIAAATAFLDAHPAYALVTGWRSEIAPRASIYNAICDHEWHRPAGDIATCGGDMMVRAPVWEDLGGQTASLIAGEDEDFCLRLAEAGHRLHRLPLAMTRHDAAITRFAQWWRRALRAGHCYAELGERHPRHFRAERARALIYGGLLPLAAIAGLALSPWLTLAALGLTALSGLRSFRGLRADGIDPPTAVRIAGFFTLAKFPNLAGMATYWLRRLRGQVPRLIEYK